MARINWLADELRKEGLDVVEVSGWKSRGSSWFFPKGFVYHHTAGSLRGGDKPSLGIIKNGRKGLAGPLSQIYIDRKGTVYCVASGRANHAGSGGWLGLSGNTSVIGLEIEHTGTSQEPWTPIVVDAALRTGRVVMDRLNRDTKYVCFSGDTTVLTDKGLKFIEHIEIGDKVWTHMDRFQPVTNVKSKESETLILKGHGHPALRTTKDHRFYSPEAYRGRSNRNTSANNLLFKDKDRWIEAKDMVGQYWTTPTLESMSKTEIPFISVNDRIGGDIDLNADFMWLLGRIVADGWATPEFGQVHVCCAKEESSDLELQVKKVFKHYSKKNNVTTDSFRFQSEVLANWIIDNFGRYADGKELPTWIFGLSPDFKDAFLFGYLSGDGHLIKESRFESSSVSKKLTFGLKLLCQSLGYRVSVHLEVGGESEIQGRKVIRKDIWRLKIATSSSSRFQILNLSNDKMISLCKNSKVGESELVYDITVAEDHSFVADGIIVHNCGHKEWTTRKIDPYGWDMFEVRAAIKDGRNTLDMVRATWNKVTKLPLGRYDYGPLVEELQKKLNAAGLYTGEKDGYFGQQTEDAVISLQNILGLATDGLYGTLTHTAWIEHELAKVPEPVTPAPVPKMPEPIEEPIILDKAVLVFEDGKAMVYSDQSLTEILFQIGR